MLLITGGWPVRASGSPGVEILSIITPGLSAALLKDVEIEGNLTSVEAAGGYCSLPQANSFEMIIEKVIENHSKEKKIVSREDIMEIIAGMETEKYKAPKRQFINSSEETSSSRAIESIKDKDKNFSISSTKKNKKTVKKMKRETGNSQRPQDINRRLDSDESNTEETHPVYTDKSRPPFFVYIKCDNNSKDKENKSLPILEASRRLVKAKLNFKCIDSHARNVWKVTFDTAHQANAAIRNSEIKNIDFIAFIPRFKVLKKGVIKSVPEEIPDEEVLQALRR